MPGFWFGFKTSCCRMTIGIFFRGLELKDEVQRAINKHEKRGDAIRAGSPLLQIMTPWVALLIIIKLILFLALLIYNQLQKLKWFIFMSKFIFVTLICLNRRVSFYLHYLLSVETKRGLNPVAVCAFHT